MVTVPVPTFGDCTPWVFSARPVPVLFTGQPMLSLAVGAVEHAEDPNRVGKGLARHPIPVMLLARLAVDRTEQGKGLGKALFKDALLRTAQAEDAKNQAIKSVLAYKRRRR